MKVLLSLALLVGVASAFPQGGGLPHGKGYDKDKYFQYINVPAPKTYEWGYRRGNPHHFREEYLSQKDHTFKAKVKWGDTHDGYGEHFFDYNHVPKHQDYHEPSYKHEPFYKPEPVYKPEPYKPVHH